MDCKKLKEPRLKSSVKSNIRTGEPEGKASHSTHGLNTTANNTSPIMCAVCGSKEYVTLNLQDKCNYPFGPNLGWNSPDIIKKNISTELTQTCGPLSPLAQAIFPQLSLFHFPSNFYCSHYNANLRFPQTPCEPIEKYFGHIGLELNAPKAGTVNSESTLYRERETEKAKSTTSRRDSTFRKEESVNGSYKKDDSRPSSAFTNRSEIRNYPVPLHPPWMGNFYPIFPYTYASLAFPFNQPVIPIYLPIPGKWQGGENQIDEENLGSSASNTPMGDSNSVQNEAEKTVQKEENNTSDYDFEAFARELLLEQKSNYDEDEVDIEVNLDEIANSLKTVGVNSGREINSEKFFNSKEKWDSSKESCQDKDEIRNWRLPNEINMQDCCIRTLSNENLWYEAQEDDKKNWDNVQDYNWKENQFNSKHNMKQDESRCDVREKEKIGDGIFHEANSVWNRDRCKADEADTDTRLYWKNGDGSRRHKVSFEESSEKTVMGDDKRNESSKLSQTEIDDEVEYLEDEINSSKDTSKRLHLQTINNQTSKLDVRYEFGEETENTSQTSLHETARHREDNYSVQINMIEIEYSVRALEEIQNSGREDNQIPTKENNECQGKEKENFNRDKIYFDWDKINEILDEYNKKFTEIGLLLKNKQVLGTEMAKSYSLLNNRKQNPKRRTDNNEIAHGHKSTERKITGITQPLPPTSPCGSAKIKREEKSKSFAGTSSKYESLKIPVSGSRKSRKPEDTKKRWLT